MYIIETNIKFERELFTLCETGGFRGPIHSICTEHDVDASVQYRAESFGEPRDSSTRRDGRNDLESGTEQGRVR
jgi:hypothetical protein